MEKKLSKRKIKEFKNINKFMGGTDIHDVGVFWMAYGLDNGRPVKGQRCTLDVMEAKYSSSFDWLMPVIKHIYDSSELAVKMKHIGGICHQPMKWLWNTLIGI